MPAWKAVALYGGWLLAAAAVAIVTGGLFGLLASGIGLGGGVASIVFDVVTVVVFALLALLPFLLRHRTTGEGRG